MAKRHSYWIRYFLCSALLCGLHLVVVTTVSFNVNLMDVETATSLFIVAAMAVSDLQYRDDFSFKFLVSDALIWYFS